VSRQVVPVAELVEPGVKGDLVMEVATGAVPLVVVTPVGREEC
jgi:hypothetical protein